MASVRMVLGILLMIAAAFCDVVQGLGVNWGTISMHPLPPYIVVQLLRDNGIKKVKLFDANLDTMRALALINLEVMVAIPNEMLEVLTLDSQASDNWVARNVTRYTFPGRVNIK